MLQWIRDFFSFQPAKNDRERYDQLILQESLIVLWRLNWSRTKEYGIWMIKFWSFVWLSFCSLGSGEFTWPMLWQWQLWFAGSLGFFFISWPSVLIFSMATYYLRFPLLFLNPLCWFALKFYGYRFEDDVQYFRRIVIIRAQDRLLSEYGIDTNLRN